MDFCPGVFLGSDPESYLPWMQNKNVRKAFAEKQHTDQFSKKVSTALAEYFSRLKYSAWDSRYWKLIDWKKEPIAEIRKMCIYALKACVDVAEVLTNVPDLWKRDAEILQLIPDNTLEALLSADTADISKEDFEYMIGHVQSNRAQELLCRHVPAAWIQELPEKQYTAHETEHTWTNGHGYDRWIDRQAYEYDDSALDLPEDW